MILFDRWANETAFRVTIAPPIAIANNTLHVPVILKSALIWYVLFLTLFPAPPSVGNVVYDFQMMSYTVCEGDAPIELILRITSPSSIFCNITVSLAATNIEAGISAA